MAKGNQAQAATRQDFSAPTLWSDSAAPRDAGEELIGVTLNDSYVVERLLGEGGMGRVYLARHTRIRQKRVAVKVLHPEFFGNAQVLARFQREAETAAAISHPNVVAVLDIDRTPHGLPYLVCEYLEGIDLADQLNRGGKLSVTTAVHVARQLCKGLAAAHASGVIHRDMKPHNIFLVGDFAPGLPERPYVKVLDFGLSRFADGSENQLTKTGDIMGTPSYMSPEQARGQRVDHRTDIYGVGVILYTALTGKAPFNEETPHATIFAVLRGEPARPRSLEPTIPAQLELVIERAMARDPAERYPDMAAFEQALTALEAESLVRPLGSLAPPPPAQIERDGRSKLDRDEDVHAARLRLVLYALAAVALLICGAVSATSGIEQAAGYHFSRVELGLLSLAIVGSSITPGLLWAVHVRRRVWDNSSRVLALLGQVRAGVVAGIVTYGLSLLALHVTDDFALRLVDNSALPTIGATWAGWSLILPALALDFAIMVVWRRQLNAQRSTWRRRFALWLVTCIGLALFGLLVAAGVWWRHRLG
ncbi:MAG TPA: serine/threonine-protein kinase [Polyangiaceae bacterium]|jgi:serine/threonine protein kinase|nr:serine/threonine-protein kinase [Polyangiaceae bacterium]